MTGRLLDRNLTSVEGVLYLKQILAEADVAEDDYKLVGTHSCKVTILSWCAMSARVSFADRRLIGHHVAPGQESVLTYSREESLRLMSIVYGILRLVMTGDLQPDLPRLHRLARLVQKEEAFGLDQTDVELGLAEEAGDDSDDCAEEDCAVQLEKLPPDIPSRTPSCCMSFQGLLTSRTAKPSSFVGAQSARTMNVFLTRRIWPQYQSVPNAALQANRRGETTQVVWQKEIAA